MNATQKLQKIADEKFGKTEQGTPEITIVFERFVGFWAQHWRYDMGSVFLGNALEAEKKLTNREIIP